MIFFLDICQRKKNQKRKKLRKNIQEKKEK